MLFRSPYFPVDVVPPDEHADFLTLLQRRFPAYVVGTEVALFTREDVLLDSQASVNVFSNKDLLHDVGVAKRTIALKGVEQGTRGVSIRDEGYFETLGKVYFSEKTTANILSYAVMIDSGNSITYERASDSFILEPKDSSDEFIFSRKPVTGSEGRFYCCNMRERRTSIERAFIETTTENMKRYTKREVESARNARDLIGRMGLTTTEQLHADMCGDEHEITFISNANPSCSLFDSLQRNGPFYLLGPERSLRSRLPSLCISSCSQSWSR